jgi:hypothetical protein
MGSVFFNPYREGKGDCYSHSHNSNCPGQPQPMAPRRLGEGRRLMSRSRVLVVDESHCISCPPRFAVVAKPGQPWSTAHPPGLVYVLAPLRKAATA